eukprot:scaffold664_cov260-Pinguiococcus_pyrenoidosus.AAC.23
MNATTGSASSGCGESRRRWSLPRLRRQVLGQAPTGAGSERAAQSGGQLTVQPYDEPEVDVEVGHFFSMKTYV